MIRLSSPCPSCAVAGSVYQATIDLPPKNAHAEQGSARECMSCGWWEITPLPAARR
jgi:hypothetical protein